jgi:hypothetical protein
VLSVALATLPEVPAPVLPDVAEPPAVSLALAVVPLSLVLAVAPRPPPWETPMLVSLPAPLAVLPPSMAPHPASAIASSPAKSTLCPLRFMINSFGWVFFRMCVTIPRATPLRG